MTEDPGPGSLEGDPLPRLLAQVGDLTARGAAPTAPGGALWRLAESGRQLDANVVHLPPGHRVDTHVEPHLDVLLLVLDGDGTLETADGSRQLTEGALLWLPHGSRRALTAGHRGLTHLTVHRRRPGLQIGSRPPAGDAGIGS